MVKQVLVHKTTLESVYLPHDQDRHVGWDRGAASYLEPWASKVWYCMVLLRVSCSSLSQCFCCRMRSETKRTHRQIQLYRG